MATMNITMSEGLAHINRAELTAEQVRENTDAQVRLAQRVQALRPIDRETSLIKSDK